MTRTIKPEELRILLFIRYCGIKKDDIYEFSAKSHLHKWYYLSRNPNYLEEFLQQYGFARKLSENPNPSELFIRNLRGVTLENIGDVLVTLKSCYFIEQITRKRTIIYSLTEAGILFLENIPSSSQEIHDYMQVLLIIKEYIDKIDFKEVLSYTNNLIKKYEHARGSIVRGDQCGS